MLSLPFALRFLLATDAEAPKQVLGIVYRTMSAYVLKKPRLARTSGATGAYLVGTEPPAFRRIAPPGEAELQALVEQLAERIGGALERHSILMQDAESGLKPTVSGPIDDLLGHSIAYRVTGPRARQKVFSLETARAREEELRKGVAQYAGFLRYPGVFAANAALRAAFTPAARFEGAEP